MQHLMRDNPHQQLPAQEDPASLVMFIYAPLEWYHIPDWTQPQVAFSTNHIGVVLAKATSGLWGAP